MQPSELATGGKLAASTDDTHLPVLDATTDIPEPNPVEPSPVDQVDSGITPMADFLPKDALNTSHPTPPPDEPLITGDADVDVEMANVESAPSPPVEQVTEVQSPPVEQVLEVESPPVVAPVESSLVRPREDDEEDEPAAKRSRLDEPPEDVIIHETEVVDVPVVEAVVDAETPPLQASASESPPEPAVEHITEVEMPLAGDPVVDPVVDAVVEPVVDPVVETIVEAAVEPAIAEPVEQVLEQVEEPVVAPVEEAVIESAVEPVIESVTETTVMSPDGDVKMETTQSELQPLDTAVEPSEGTALGATLTETPITQTPIDEKPVETPVTPVAPPQIDGATDLVEQPKYSTEPMTTMQRSALLEKTKNLKKTKNSMAFLKPVDYVALNIPTYPDIIKEPMDLSTMESKLKEGKYHSVSDFAYDFDLIIQNARRFNGDQHPVTQAGLAMEAYFKRMMQSVPSADEQPLPKQEKKRSPSIPREKRRESRSVTQPAAPAAPAPPTPSTAPTEVYALHADGTPQIRRQSSISNRPARAIKPPQNREIPYAKPKRKEHQLELRFCEHILEELKTPKYASSNSVFLYPVDPVALNIPHYRQIVKTPMDLTTMSQKLKSGQYGTAAEFKKDFELMIKNCLLFNPVGNPVRDLGIQFQRDFESLWANKDKWERKNQPPSNRASSASGDEESGADDEAEDDEPEDDKTATIRALQKQLADMQNALSGLGGGGDKSAKSKKAKGSQSSSKKQVERKPSSIAKKPVPKPASKPKKQRLVTYEEKQEISEAVNNMNEGQISKLTEIITTHDPKYRDMEEMELEIDELTNEVQHMLLTFVRQIFGNPKKAKAREPSPDDAAAVDDDDYEEKGGARGGKRKKHRPMGKKEQQDTITSIKNKLAEFTQVATSGSESPTNSSFVAANAQADTSGDEESEESEEE